MTRSLLIGIAVIALGALVYWRRPLSPGPARPKAIVLISIDTCRADHLSCYGYAQTTTPHIDALASEAVRFRNVISPAPVTLPAHCSMLTGTLPPYHGVHDNGDYRLGDANVTAAEVLRAAGYRTMAVVGAYVLDPQFGLGQGFDAYDATFAPPAPGRPQPNMRNAAAVSDVAIEWIDAHADEPFFLFVHYFDPHFPYEPPPPFDTRFAANPYAGEIAYVDQHVGRIIERLKARGLYEESLIVVTADHGEGLGEHGEATHGYFVYHSTTRVPLIIKPPGARSKRTVHNKVALVDLAPTILEIAGADTPPEVQGRSLRPMLNGKKTPGGRRAFFSESLLPTEFGCNPLLAVEDERWKLIHTTHPELYDLAVDPNETRNVIDEHPQTASALRDEIEAILESPTVAAAAPAAVSPDDDATERLAALGYVGGTATSIDFDPARPDPKDLREVFGKVEQAAYTLFNHPDPASKITIPSTSGGTIQVRAYKIARQLCHEALAIHPRLARAHELLGKMAALERDWPTAAEHYQKVAEADPTSPVAQAALADVHLEQGRLEAAVERYERAIELAELPPPPTDLPGRLNRLARIPPSMHGTRVNLGQALTRLARADEAIPHLRSAVDESPTDAKARYWLGIALMRVGRYDDAIDTLRGLRKRQPDNPAVRQALDAARKAKRSAPLPFRKP